MILGDRSHKEIKSALTLIPASGNNGETAPGTCVRETSLFLLYEVKIKLLAYIPSSDMSIVVDTSFAFWAVHIRGELSHTPLETPCHPQSTRGGTTILAPFLSIMRDIIGR